MVGIILDGGCALSASNYGHDDANWQHDHNATATTVNTEKTAHRVRETLKEMSTIDEG